MPAPLAAAVRLLQRLRVHILALSDSPDALRNTLDDAANLVQLADTPGGLLAGLSPAERATLKRQARCCRRFTAGQCR